MNTGEDADVPRDPESPVDVDEKTVVPGDETNAVAGTTNASVAVVNSVSEERGIDPLDLPPLYAVVEPDALDALFADNGLASAARTGTVSFEYADCMVTVKGRSDVSAESFSD